MPNHLDQPRGRPLSKGRAAGRPHAIANGEDDVKVVMFNVPAHLPRTFALNYSEIPNSCHRVEFLLIVNVVQVLVYGWDCHLKQLGDRRCDNQTVWPSSLT